MLRPAERGCLVIADISGYTGLLSGTELEHAQDALRDLMQTVVGQLRPAFRLAKLEGDAAFVYAATDRLDGQLLMDTLEGAYFAFRRRLDAISRATTCDCNACLRIPGLDLKIVAHHGSFVRERMFGSEELTGTDVIVVHRLLKNAVAEQLGHAAYLLLTDACVAAAGLDPADLGLVAHVAEAEGIGAVRCWIHDLAAAWRREQEQRRVRVGPRQAAAQIEADLPLRPSDAWRYLTEPELRLRWQPGIVGFEQELVAGRRGIGTVNHCVHGDGAVLEEILDWRPFDYYTLRSTLPGAGAFISTSELAETPEGSRVTIRIRRPSNAAERELMTRMGPMLHDLYRVSIESLRTVIERDLAEGRAATPA